jgi:hypothetical protein
MALASTYQERKKVSELISAMLDSSFYLEMKLKERLKLIKVLMVSPF